MTAKVSFVMPDMSVSGSSNKPSIRVPPLTGLLLLPALPDVGPQAESVIVSSTNAPIARYQKLRFTDILVYLLTMRAVLSRSLLDTSKRRVLGQPHNCGWLA